MSQPVHSRSLIGRYPLTSFFGLAYVIAWAIWGSRVAKLQGWIAFEVPGAETLGLFGSSIAAAIVVWRSEGHAGLKALASTMLRWRFHPVWYMAAVALPFVLGLITVGAQLALGGESPIARQFSLGLMPLYFVSEVLLHLLTEEPGWRGFALPRMQARFGAVGASLLLGVLWGFWHYPLFLIPGRPQTQMPLIGMVLAVTATSVLFTWVRNRTGSGFSAVVFHAAMNSAFVALGTLTSGPRLFWLSLAVWALAAVAIILWGGLKEESERAAVNF